MTEYVHLVGAAEVQSAARTIRTAADEIFRGASTFDNAVHAMRQGMQEHQTAMADFVDRLEKLKHEVLTDEALIAECRRRRLNLVEVTVVPNG